MRKTFRDIVAQYFMDKNNGLIDLDKAHVMANELWYNAAHGDKKSQKKLGMIARQYQKRELA